MAYYPTRYYPTRYYAPRYYPAPSAALASTFRAALVAALKADAATSAIVGAKVFPIYQPQTQAPPSVAFQVLSDQAEHHLGGHAGTNLATVGFTARSRLLTECEALDLCIFNLFDGYSGTIPESSVVALSVLHQDDDDSYLPSLTADDRGTFEASSVYVFRYQKAVPSR